MKPGTRHRATQLAEKMMTGSSEAVVKAVITAAEEGDMVAARIILDRIAPPSRGRRIELDLPTIAGSADLLRALCVVTGAMARGELSAEEALSAAAVLNHSGKAIEIIDLERRIAALENGNEPKAQS